MVAILDLALLQTALSGTSEAQKQKILEKRAKKDAKAATKKAAKQTKGVLLSGEGVKQICTILKDANSDLSKINVGQMRRQGCCPAMSSASPRLPRVCDVLAFLSKQ